MAYGFKAKEVYRIMSDIGVLNLVSEIFSTQEGESQSPKLEACPSHVGFVKTQRCETREVRLQKAVPEVLKGRRSLVANMAKEADRPAALCQGASAQPGFQDVATRTWPRGPQGKCGSQCSM